MLGAGGLGAAALRAPTAAALEDEETTPDDAERIYPVGTDVDGDTCTNANGEDLPTTGEGAVPPQLVNPGSGRTDGALLRTPPGTDHVAFEPELNEFYTLELEGEPGPVEYADENDDGAIDDQEGSDAITAWARGEYTNQEVSKVVVAWARTENWPAGATTRGDRPGRDRPAFVPGRQHGTTMTDVEDSLTPFLALVGIFVTCLVTAQVIGSKIIAIVLPFVGTLTLPVLGAATLPGGTFAYAGTFYATDCLSELYGKRVATRVVQVAFAMNFVLLALIYLTIAAPVADQSVVPADEFASVLGAAPSIVAGSLIAYLISQHWDVFAFHRVREWTGGDYLWVRNLASTGTSQFLDTLVFTVVAFGIAPALLPGGRTLPPMILAGIVLVQYAAKLLIAVGDTPLVYATVALVRNRVEEPTPAPA